MSSQSVNPALVFQWITDNVKSQTNNNLLSLIRHHPNPRRSQSVPHKHTSSGSAQSEQAADDSSRAVQMWSRQPVRCSPAAHPSKWKPGAWVRRTHKLQHKLRTMSWAASLLIAPACSVLPHELLITQQAQFVGIPDAGITQSKMASDNAGLAWHSETRQLRASHFSNVSPQFAPAWCLFSDLVLTKQNLNNTPASKVELKVFSIGLFGGCHPFIGIQIEEHSSPWTVRNPPVLATVAPHPSVSCYHSVLFG